MMERGDVVVGDEEKDANTFPTTTTIKILPEKTTDRKKRTL